MLDSAIAERLPVAEELYANGPHPKTRTIEIGNPNLGAETSRHLDLGIRSEEGEVAWSITAFITHFDDFIFLRDSGEDDRDEVLPTYNYTQQDADFNWSVETAGGSVFEVLLIGTNLADEDARKHTSFVKETAPLPGRNFSAGFRSHF